MWTYKGVDIYPAGRNMSGLRWTATIADDRRFSESTPPNLMADTKQGMRELINHYLGR